MKKSFLQHALIVLLTCIGAMEAFSQANTSLSNLTSPTSVNQSLTPSSNNSKNLGSSSAAWKDGWFAGKVAIGATTTPLWKLHLKETTSTTQEVLRIEGFDPLIQFYEGSTIGYLRAIDGNMRLATNSSNSSGDLQLGTQSNVHMTIDQNGEVGIGTTTTVGKLSVSSDGSSSTPQLYLFEQSSDELSRIRFRTFTGGIGDESAWDVAALTSTSGDNFRISHLNNAGTSSTLMYLSESGNMGLGTLFPQVKLHLDGSSEILRLSGSTPYIGFTDGSNQSTFIQASGNDLRMGTLSGNSTGKMIFRFNGTNKNAMDVNGNFGLGTTSPAAKLHINAANEAIRIEGTNSFIQFYSGTTAKSFIQRSNNDLKIGISSGNTSGNVILNVASTNLLYLMNDGTVGIGISETEGHKLGVDGSIVCEELKVKLSQNWPDYVFASEYKLPSLTEVEQAIKLNKHLPGIPSAKQINDDGINVGEMQKLMMQKIEELTLYVIDLQKQNVEQQMQNEELRLQIAELKH